MKRKNTFKLIGLFLIALYSCVSNEDFSIPTLGKDKEYKNLKSLSDITKLYQGSLVNFKEEITTYGYVISSDRDGNFYKSVFIQDSPINPTIGIEIKIDDTNLNARYAIGRKIFIKLKGLSLNKTNGTYQIGSKNIFGNGIDHISINDYVHFIDRSSEISDITPTSIDVSEINEKHNNTLVKINNVQATVKGLQYATPSNNKEYIVNRTLISCNTLDSLILTNSVFTSFKHLFIPDKKGSITGILNCNANKKHITIRHTDDISFNEIYGCFHNPAETSLDAIRPLFTGAKTKIVANLKIKVFVTSDASNKSISNNEAFVQDKTAGISLFFSDTHDLNVGDEIEIAVGGLYLSKSNGLLQLELASSNVISKTTNSSPTPELITIAQALSGDYESKLVKIENVQFKDTTKTYAFENTVTSDCTDALKIAPTKTTATFANKIVSNKSGLITGIMTHYNEALLHIRKESDIVFTIKHNCSTNDDDTPHSDLYFSEYAEGSGNDKYIEIYNDTGTTINLANYTLQLYRNGTSKPSKRLMLNELKPSEIANKETIVIYNTKSNDNIKSKGDFSSSVVFFNGNDAIALLKNDVIIDVIGQIGEDPGSGWNVAGIGNATKDHTLVRKLTISKGNKDWTKSAGTNTSNSEWEIKDKDDFSSIGNR